MTVMEGNKFSKTNLFAGFNRLDRLPFKLTWCSIKGCLTFLAISSRYNLYTTYLFFYLFYFATHKQNYSRLRFLKINHKHTRIVQNNSDVYG